MHEIYARRVLVATTALAILLSILFALLQAQ
jgi:hypothetical protein